MTKYILHGGYTRIKNKFNEMFFKEVLSGFEKSVKVLLVLFARPDKDWPMLEKREKDHFTKSRSDLVLHFDIANKETNSFIKQIINLDVIYILGGENKPLQDELKKVTNLKELFNGKLVVGSSAGAYVLSKYYYSHEDDGIFEGLGILPVKVIAHYKSDIDDNKVEELKNYKEDLKLYKLPETEYVVIEE